MRSLHISVTAMSDMDIAQCALGFSGSVTVVNSCSNADRLMYVLDVDI